MNNTTPFTIAVALAAGLAGYLLGARNQPPEAREPEAPANLRVDAAYARTVDVCLGSIQSKLDALTTQQKKDVATIAAACATPGGKTTHE